MTINRVGSGVSPLSEYPQKGQNTNEAKVASKKVGDKLEISEEAKIKNSESVNASKLAMVDERIANGFYDKEEVISSVADSILKEIEGK